VKDPAEGVEHQAKDPEPPKPSEDPPTP